ncbi:CCA tRNA nucleotidyltransferase [Clostridium sardiniense]|uniref:CCA tRNA nucleotidyltransferase n=1 Tax=Clostridium sardiniense TaxID=29369 RepID=UPI0019585E8B|nr:HD domain-containing protein [Clostridium sardiniense]MBM7836343.1 tRNA nucleotidyltransferase (CCA-adding enzyme) [Clostridium sardiniense]
MQINIPTDVEFIIKKLQNNNKKAFVVGGCVRDSILGRVPKDWDICTNATPEEVIKLFNKTIPTGLKHGTITVMINNEGYEVATFRIEDDYDDSRHPNKVEFVDDIVKDLSRRDLTINSMAYNYEDGLIDPFNGYIDILNKFIRAVGDPDKRFNEDALRMLRAIRFSAQLGFKIDEETRNSIRKFSDKIKYISVERIRCELEKIIMSDAYKIDDLVSLGLLKYIIPELCECIDFNQDNPYHCFNVYKHIINTVYSIDKEPHLKLTMLLHDICKPQCKTIDENGIGHFYGHAELSSEKAKDILKRLKYDNETINKVTTLVKYHDRQIGKKKSIRKLLSEIGEDNFKDLLKIKRADIFGQNKEYLNVRLDELAEIRLKLDEVIEQQECFTIKDLAINGRDLIDLGVAEGKEIGEYLNCCLERVLEDPNLNNKSDLIKACNNKLS